MRLKPSDIGACWDHALSRMRNLRQLGFVPRAILDIGAYHGSWSEVMWHVWPESRYHLIEANEDCRPQLERTGFKFDIALLSDIEKDVTYHKCQTGSGEGNSMYPEKTVYPFAATSARTKTLTQVLGNQVFDFIKLDAQGSELSIIQGGESIIRAGTLVQVECQIQQYNAGSPLAIEVINHMDDLGFRLYDVIESHFNSRGMLIQTDFLFARKDCGLFGLKVLS